MARNIEIHVRPALKPFAPDTVELCEHKGVGHPDTLTDAVCEAASRTLSREYLRQTGRVLHHNLDKGLLMAGRSRPRFGGGTVEQPMRFLICGRASPLPDGNEPAALARQAVLEHLRRHAGIEMQPAQVLTEIGPTSGNLQQLFRPVQATARANDTSFGVGFAPYSPLEQCVLALAGVLRSAAFRARFPAAGLDFKLMGCRQVDELTLTVALAFIDRHVGSVAQYFELKQAVHDELARHLPARARLRLNALDDPQAQDESGLYLTVTGFSGEMGDDGQVGRGNRVNGLITPGRPMSLEAAAGKNPVSHVGKLYNVLALLIARDIHRELRSPGEVTVQLLSAIGDPVDEPQVAAIDITSARPLSPAERSFAKQVAARWLGQVGQVTGLILDERVPLY
ncbi:MAG: methionine adenosyltransferase [Pseudomonadota bacterium]